tara:strand:+ start:3300 stop:3515 length:216 start_codon:yes stop_codon:yes gene_type:complete
MIETYISIELEGRDIVQLHNELDSLVTGSLEITGGGMMIGGTTRDIDFISDTQEEADAFLELLTSKGYKLQ